MRETLPLTITGRVVAGEQVGRTIGFPTANIETDLSGLQVETGVYWSQCTLSDGTTHFALTYFGPRLIFNETQTVLESYILDFDDDIYQQTITVTLLEHTRPPQKVESLDQLKTLLQQDLAWARARLAELESNQV